MKRLSIQHIIMLHDVLLKETGGASGLKDEGLLESAANVPFATFGGNDLYPTIQQKGARLGLGLIKNHAFVDGNKRVGILVMLTFLEINGIDLTCTDDELIAVGLDLAAGSMTEDQLLSWIIKHS